MKEFSGVKLTITIICAVLIMTFFGSVSLFINASITSTEAYLIDEIYDLAKYSDDVSSEKATEALTEIGENMEEQLDSVRESLEEDKEILGDDFPAEGLFIYRLICVCQSNEIVTTFEWCLALGIVTGIGIYIIVIQRANGKQLLKELLLAAIVLVFVVIILMSGYEAILNLAIELESLNITIFSDYNLILKLLLIYVVSNVIIYLINLMYEKVFRKDLDKKNEEEKNKSVKRKTTKTEASVKKSTPKKTSTKKDTTKKETKSKESK